MTRGGPALHWTYPAHALLANLEGPPMTTTEPQTPDPVTPTLHNVLYGALSASLLDHGVRLEPYVRAHIRDDLERAIAEFNGGQP